MGIGKKLYYLLNTMLGTSSKHHYELVVKIVILNALTNMKYQTIQLTTYMHSFIIIQTGLNTLEVKQGTIIYIL